MVNQFSTPILFIIFNRPGTTVKVFEKIKELKPGKLYVAADGPRLNKKGEQEMCEQSRKVVLDDITWDCEVKSLVRSENLGCKRAVSSAITWFFENEEKGIILEDDCLPDLSFFSYCELLLEKYEDENSVMQISGTNFLNKDFHINSSYYFSKIPHIWGWATWRRAWNLYDINMCRLDELMNNFEYVSTDRRIKNYWMSIFKRVKQDKINTWDYQWVYSIWVNNGLCVCPSVNMISNVGFGPDATHTKEIDKTMANLKTERFTITQHPTSIKPNVSADEYDMRKSIKNGSVVKNILKRAVGLLYGWYRKKF